MGTVMKFNLVVALSFAFVATSMSKAVKSVGNADVLAKQMVDDILQGKDSNAKNDFIFLLHNLVHGMGQAIIHGDKEQKDYFYGYGDRRPYYHHHYYGNNNNNDDHFYNGDHHGY